ncbi:hypothetical protein HRbin36_01082 [bacterium HR36]|nr:hypothetical protein HRbin36_01082 [bacterium HR36]
MSDTPPTLPGILPRALAAWLKRLRLSVRRALEAGAGGQFASLFRGAGVSFEELREYQPGDDIRAIEWKATARLGVPFVKRFIEERELSVVIAVDKSGSMAFGGNSRNKWHTAVETAALLVLLAAYNRDRVGLALFDSTLRRFLPPRRGLRQAWRDIALMLLQRPEREPTSLGQVCQMLLRLLRRRALLLLISDFLDTNYAADFQRLALRHEVIAVRIYEPAEAQLPTRGWFLLEDAETAQRAWFDVRNRMLRQHWSAVAERFTRELQDTARSAGADLWTIPTSEDLLTSLRHWLTQRQLRLRHHASARPSPSRISPPTPRGSADRQTAGT